MNKMNKICFVIKGKTFLKPIIPLIAFSNNLELIPVVFFYKERAGKAYDSLSTSDIDSIISKLSKANVLRKCEFYWVDNEKDIIDFMKLNNLNNIVCQDAQHHYKKLCAENKIKVFSIGVFFDTLHYANDLRLKSTSYENEHRPDVIYFPNEKFLNEFKTIYSKYQCEYRCLGSPLYDHSIFIDYKLPAHERQEASICFLTTLQYLVPEALQQELEDFVEYCIKNEINVYVKGKKKTPWVFKNKNLINDIIYIEEEKGFPYTSLELILKTDLHIASFSTSAIESSYFGKPSINLDTIDKNKLTYAVHSIKHDYNFEDVFNSDICKTISENIKDTYHALISTSKKPEEVLTYDSNNSLRILKDIKTFL
tara:strand:+ start:13352 stop:14452 length:1101 start_codon:yes stop_codon:yes gene_type:complete